MGANSRLGAYSNKYGMPREGAVGFSVFRFFGFGVRCRFRVFSFLTSGFRFLAKNTSGFSVSGNFLSGLSVFH